MNPTSSNPCFIIAEAGVNHNGDIKIAKQLIDAAKTAGADAVKFQTWITELLVTEDSSSAEYQQQNTGEQSQYELLKSLELSHDQFGELQRYADEVGIMFLSTPDEETSAKFLIQLGLPIIKIGSGELTNLPFLKFIAKHNVPMIISTGMSTLDEVSMAVDAINLAGNKSLTILHCVSNYPALPDECNLRAMDTMAKKYHCPVGYSDHTMGIDVCLAAVALGATVIEKHLTLDRNMKGPDHSCSSEPEEFSSLVSSIRNIEASLGDGIKLPTPSEIATRKIVRKEITAAKDLTSGEHISAGDLTLKRGNGTGLEPCHLNQIIGKQLTANVSKNHPIKLQHIAE